MFFMGITQDTMSKIINGVLSTRAKCGAKFMNFRFLGIIKVQEKNDSK